ncbi:Uncharacterised protein [Bacteroides xylanisolvens]|nr:Uncharacterised protein [Bacteroides xylanisolvens]
MEGDVLLQCYISRCVPEAAVFLQQFIVGQLPAANAICKYTLLYIKVCYINAPRPWFLCIDSAIAKTCCPYLWISIQSGVDIVVTSHAEIANRRNNVRTNDFIFAHGA